MTLMHQAPYLPLQWRQYPFTTPLMSLPGNQRMNNVSTMLLRMRRKK